MLSLVFYTLDVSTEEKRTISNKKSKKKSARGARKNQLIKNANQTASSAQAPAAIAPSLPQNQSAALVKNESSNAQISPSIPAALNETAPVANKTTSGNATKTVATEIESDTRSATTALNVTSPSAENATTPTNGDVSREGVKEYNETIANIESVEQMANVTTPSNCTSPECACQKSCYPKLVANVSIFEYFVKSPVNFSAHWRLLLPS